MSTNPDDLQKRVEELEAEVTRLRTGPRVQSVRKRSELTIAGVPLYEIATGPDPERGELRGHAKAIIAIGDIATGIVAIGGMARGVFAVGGLSVGILSVGGCSFGILASLGGVSGGGLAFGGVAIGYYAIGGVAIGIKAVGGAAVPIGRLLQGL